MPPSFAQPEEYRAATERCTVFDAAGRELLRVTGPDRASFLHGMVTNDVEGLAVGQACYAAMLTVKGSMVGDVRIVKLADALVLDTGPGCAETVKAFLEKYLISEDAEVHLAPDLAVLSLVGPRASETAARLPPALPLGRFPGLVEGVDLVLPRAALEVARTALGDVPALSPETHEVLRVEHGVPRFGVDMTEATIPLEAGLDRAIHYQKGCYIGQEVIARATYRGQMNKKLVRLLLGDAAPEPRTELRRDEKKVGWVTSVVVSPKHGQHLALGYVHRDHLAPGTTFAIASGGTAALLG